MTPLFMDPSAPRIVTRTYDKILLETELPKATYVFTDVDRMTASERIQAGRLYRRLVASGCQVFNDPGRVATRFPLLRSLYRAGINKFNVYLIDEVVDPMRFPVFLRVANDHRGPLTDLIPNQETLKRAIDALVQIGYPPSELIVIEYAAEPIRPGIFRKLSVFKAGGRLLPHPCVHDVGWNIKLGRAAVATTELYEEELEIIKSNRFAEQMKPVFEIAGVDFGRVDFGIVDGRPSVYEINTNPQISPPSPHPVPQRVESGRLWWEGFLSAMHKIDAPEDEALLPDLTLLDATILGRALDTYAGVKGGFLELAEALSRRGEHDAAIRNANLALERAQGDLRVIKHGSRLLADSGCLSEAIEVVDQALEAEPENFELLICSARFLCRAGRAKAAVATASRAIAVRSEDPSGYEALSQAHKAAGNTSAELKAVKSAVACLRKGAEPAAANLLRELLDKERALRMTLVAQQMRRLFQRPRDAF